MVDRIDEMMAKHWSSLQGQIGKGLKVEPKISEFLPVEVGKAFGPYRVASPVKSDAIRPAPRDPSNADIKIDLRRFNRSAVEGAFELTVVYDLRLSALDGDVGTEMQAFGAEARLAERRAVLEQLGSGGRRKLNEANIKTGLKRFGSPCTLVWVGCGKVKEANFGDLVDACVDPHGCLPDGIDAILIPQVSGPTMVRIIDDMTSSWERKSTDTVQLVLAERFFLDRSDRAERFTA